MDLTLRFDRSEVMWLLPPILLACWAWERRAGAKRQGVLLRALGLGLLVLVLARPSLATTGRLAALVLVDASTDVRPGALDEALGAAGLPRPDVGVLRFGGRDGVGLNEVLDQTVRLLPGGGRLLVLAGPAAVRRGILGPGAGVSGASGEEMSESSGGGESDASGSSSDADGRSGGLGESGGAGTVSPDGNRGGPGRSGSLRSGWSPGAMGVGGTSLGAEWTTGGRMGAGALETAAWAAGKGLRLDGVLLPGPESAVPRDAAVTRMDAPVVWRAGEDVPVTVGVRATEPISGTLVVTVNGEPAARRSVALRPGYSALTFGVPNAQGRTGGEDGSSSSGTGSSTKRSTDLRLRAALEVQDEVALDDAMEAVTSLAAPPRVLVVGDAPGAIGLADLLRAQGMAVTVIGPARLPSRLSAFDPWDTVVLVDVPAAALGTDQLAALEAQVADGGHGLVLIGGPQSFLPGGWEGTALADLAPVRLDPPPRDEHEAVALVLIVDQSASMGSVEGKANVTKLDLAREAAILATEALGEGDRIGVVTYDDAAHWLLPLATVGSGRRLAEVEGLIGGLATGGGTRILAGLQAALPALASENVPTRHAVLLTDGRDFNPEAAAYDATVQAARAAGVTLSTIAIGADADRELLERLARLGRGRYHSADDPGDLPRLAQEESRVVRARSEQLGEFRARVTVGGGYPMLAGVDVAALPALRGYLAMGRREGAEVALEAPGGDPLLSGWQYGLGRVVAWSSDAGEAWASEWTSPAAAKFWERLVRHVARTPADSRLAVAASPDDAGGAWLSAVVSDAEGKTVDLAEVSAVVTGTSSGGPLGVSLNQVAPGSYAAYVPLPEQGAFPAAIRARMAAAPLGSGSESGQAAEGELTLVAPVPIVRPYSAALRPLAPAARPEQAMSLLTTAGGGAVLASAAGALPPAPRGTIPLWPWLVGLALGVWLADVARQMGGLAWPVRRQADLKP